MDDTQPHPFATGPDLPRRAATSGDTDYTLAIDDVSEIYARAGHARTTRTLQRYCVTGHLDAQKVATTLGDKFFVTPQSVARHIEQIRELNSLDKAATGRDHPRFVATHVATVESHAEQPTPTATDPDQSRQDAAGRTQSREVAPGDQHVSPKLGVSGPKIQDDGEEAERSAARNSPTDLAVYEHPYVKRLEDRVEKLEAKYEAYWRRLLLPVLPMPKLGRMAKGLVPNLSGLSLGPTSRLTGVMEADAVARVHALARNSGCTLNNVVGAAFASVLARRGGVDGIYFNTPFAGRVHPDLRSFVGFVCDYVPVRCDVTAAGSLGALSRAIGDQMRQSYQHMPASVTKCDAAFDDLINGAGGHLRQFECGMFIPESAIRGSLLAPVLDGDLGRVIRLGPVEIEWLEAAGTRADAAEFDLRILERKGGLELILNYDTEAFEATEAQDILAEIVALLSAA